MEQFAPSRANPVASRHVRSYYAQQPLTGTSTFENLTFQIEQTNPRNVINEMRLVFPLEMRAYSADASGDNLISIPMHTNSWSRASNIAVGQNSPFSAFRNLEIAINGKVYSDQFQRYGKCLGQCFQSYSELQFQNDESLKPVANNFTGTRRDAQNHQILNPDGSLRRNIRIVDFDPEPQTFSLLENNSGFLARARRFQAQLQEDGKIWKGEISSLFNSSLFNSEARRSGNDQIPYVQSLYVNAVFDSNESSFDTKYSWDVLKAGGEQQLTGYERTIPQQLFEFLTEINSGFAYEERSSPPWQFPLYYSLKWTAQPRIEIEWVTYSQALLAPAYKLRGLRYQHEDTLPFQIPWAPEVENRNWVTATMQRQILAVPNLIYIWVSQTKSSGRDMFGMGGVFRTCDIKQNSLKIRVNGAVDIIQGPSDELLYKWYKRNTASVFEFPTWEKNKVIVISPSEVGLSEWLANQASVSTLDISLETSYSTLQLPETKLLTTFQGMFRAGYSNSKTVDNRDHSVNIVGVFPEDEGVDSNYVFRLEPEMLPDQIMTTDETLFYISMENQRKAETFLEYTESIFNLSKAFWNDAFGNSVYQLENKQSAGEFIVKDVKRVFTSWVNGATYWIKVQPATHMIETDETGHAVIWVFDETHVFEPISESVTNIQEVSWEMFVHPNNLEADATNPQIIASKFTGDQAFTTARRQAFWNEVVASEESLRCNVYFVKSTTEQDEVNELGGEIFRDSYGKSLSRSAVFQLNTMNPRAESKLAEFYFPDRGSLSKEVWSIGNQGQRFELSFDEGWNWDTNIVDFNALIEESDTLMPSIDRYEMDGGWRWAKMADPSNLYTDGDDSNLRPFEYNDWDNDKGIHRPQQVVTCRVEVQRGVNEWVLRDEVSWGEEESRGYNIIRKYYAAAGDVSPVTNFEYSLNVLLEYNNETVLLSQDRGKPVHFPNLMFPQGRAALPSQEDSYLAS
ncbi:TPA: hypothetical protein EYN23_01765 [Candidatus Poribacteria bacterium]|nr:hypothetical protein [Candidatus Poribacteria bacterium]